MEETKAQRKVRLARELRHKRKAEAGMQTPAVVKGPPKKKVTPVVTPVFNKPKVGKPAGLALVNRKPAAKKPTPKRRAEDQPMVVISFRDTKAAKEKFEKLGGSEWARKALKAAKP